MKKLTKKDLEPLPQIKEQIERLRQTYEAFASLAGEDVSRLNFGPEFPKQLNATLAKVAAAIQRAMRPVEQARDLVRQQLEAEPGAAPKIGPRRWSATGKPGRGRLR